MAWVSLDRFDDDPALLLTLLASAYARVAPGNDDLVSDVSGRGVSVLGRATPRLASVLKASARPFVLILDDLHELTSPECHDVLSVVIGGVPAGSQLIAASRAEQPHLPRLRASDDAFELGADRSRARRVWRRTDLFPNFGHPHRRRGGSDRSTHRRMAGRLASRRVDRP